MSRRTNNIREDSDWPVQEEEQAHYDEEFVVVSVVDEDEEEEDDDEEEEDDDDDDEPRREHGVARVKTNIVHARRGDGGRDERVRIAEHGGREKEPRQRELKHVLRVSVKLLNKKNPFTLSFTPARQGR